MVSRVARVWSARGVWGFLGVWLRPAMTAWLAVWALLDALAAMAEMPETAETAGGGMSGLDAIGAVSASTLDLASSPLSPWSIQQARQTRVRLFGQPGRNGRSGHSGHSGHSGQFVGGVSESQPLPTPADHVASGDSAEHLDPPNASVARWRGYYYRVDGAEGVDTLLALVDERGAVMHVVWLRRAYPRPLAAVALN